MRFNRQKLTTFELLDMVEMCSSINSLTLRERKRICHDFDIPIQLFVSPYFELSLFEYLRRGVNIIDKFENALKTVEDQRSVSQDIFAYGQQLVFKVVDFIKEQAAYKKFCLIDMNDVYPMKSLRETSPYMLKEVDIYKVTGKDEEYEVKGFNEFTILDISNANFNVLKTYIPEAIGGVSTYSELVNKVAGGSQYLKDSKYLRQVIFGNLNPKRIQRLQRFFLEELYDSIRVNAPETAKYLLGRLGSDALVFPRVCSFDLPNKYNSVKVENVRIRQMKPHPFFVIEHRGKNEVEFKQVPTYFFSQVFKKYFDEPIEENDLNFQFEGLLAALKEPLEFFDSTPSMHDEY